MDTYNKPAVIKCLMQMRENNHVTVLELPIGFTTKVKLRTVSSPYVKTGRLSAFFDHLFGFDKTFDSKELMIVPGHKTVKVVVDETESEQEVALKLYLEEQKIASNLNCTILTKTQWTFVEVGYTLEISSTFANIDFIKE